MNKKRVFFIIACGLLLLLLYVFMRRMENADKSDAPWPPDITWDEPYVGHVDVKCIVDGYSQEPVKVFLRDKEAFFCLPSFAAGRGLTLSFDEKYFEVSADGSRLYCGDGIQPETKRLDIAYLSRAYGRIERTYDLSVMYSRDLPAVFLETKSGSLERMDADKLNLDSGYLNCVDSDGADLGSVRIDFMRAKGQSSFTLAKKNYKLNLQKETALLGMETGSSWVLLANAMDTSHLRNAAAFELAKALGIGGVVDYRYADVYFNGEYHGNYMLVQSVDYYFEKHMAPDRDSFLLEKETWEERLKSEAVYLDRGEGVYWEFVFPEFPGKEYRDRASLILDGFEDAVDAACVSADLRGLSEIADEESLARKYILDVLTNEPDSNSHSTFCTYDSLSGKFIMAPVWDYDRAWGNRPDINRYPELESFSHSWPEKLIDNPAYRDLCKQVMDESSENVEYLYREWMDDTADRIAASWAMDRCVNGGGISTVLDFEDQKENTEYLKSAFEEGYSGLCAYLDDPKSYVHVYFESREGRAYRIKKGECIPYQVMGYLEKLYGCGAFVSDEGCFDENTPVYTDLVVYPAERQDHGEQ